MDPTREPFHGCVQAGQRWNLIQILPFQYLDKCVARGLQHHDVDKHPISVEVWTENTHIKPIVVAVDVSGWPKVAVQLVMSVKPQRNSSLVHQLALAHRMAQYHLNQV